MGGILMFHRLRRLPLDHPSDELIIIPRNTATTNIDRSFAIFTLKNVNNIREIKHGVVRQTANAILAFLLLPLNRILKKNPQKYRAKLYIHDKHTSTHCRAQTPDGRRRSGIFLPFAGRTNAMLNLTKKP